MQGELAIFLLLTYLTWTGHTHVLLDHRRLTDLILIKLFGVTAP